MTILILDDDPFALKMISKQIRSLERPGESPYDIITFEGAEAALRYLENAIEDVDLLLCDLQLPGVDGVEVVRRLKRMSFPGRLALISGEDRRTLASARQLAISHGLAVVGAMPKPLDPELLEHILRSSVLDRPRTAAGSLEFAAADVEKAVQEGQLVNYYQPKVCVATGVTLGMEALVRWQHPTEGLVLPGDFLPAAAQGGLMSEVAAAVIDTAFADLAEWRRAGHDWEVSVNVTMSNLMDLGLPDVLMRCAARRGVPLDRVTLEVTASQLMHDPVSQLDVLTRLRLKRVRLAIDDFGSGYAGMAQLRDIPFDELKIDRSFVHGACADDALFSMLASSVQLASDLGLASVGGGVENEDDFNCLQRVGCGRAQGFFIARPMPSRLLESWHSAWYRRARELCH